MIYLIEGESNFRRPRIIVAGYGSRVSCRGKVVVDTKFRHSLRHVYWTVVCCTSVVDVKEIISVLTGFCSHSHLSTK